MSVAELCNFKEQGLGWGRGGQSQGEAEQCETPPRRHHCWDGQDVRMVKLGRLGPNRYMHRAFWHAAHLHELPASFSWPILVTCKPSWTETEA